MGEREGGREEESRWEGVAWGNQAAGDANVTDVLTFKLNRKLRMFNAGGKTLAHIKGKDFPWSFTSLLSLFHPGFLQ